VTWALSAGFGLSQRACRPLRPIGNQVRRLQQRQAEPAIDQIVLQGRYPLEEFNNCRLVDLEIRAGDGPGSRKSWTSTADTAIPLGETSSGR
jgi:hypothetical protein